MIIDEAIKVNKGLLEMMPNVISSGTVIEAQKLGIEALEEIQLLRRGRIAGVPIVNKLLPSETES